MSRSTRGMSGRFQLSVMQNRDVMLDLRTPVRAVVQALAISAVLVLVAGVSGWAPWVAALLAMAAIAWSAMFAPPVRLRLTKASHDDHGSSRLEVTRWRQPRVYPLDEVRMSVNDFRVSVPVCHLAFREGSTVGPTLISDEAVTFMQELIRLLRAEGRDRDAVLWSHVQALERYFRKAGY